MESASRNTIVQSLDDAVSDVQHCLILKFLTQCSSPVKDAVKIKAPVLVQPNLTQLPRFLDGLCFLCNRDKAGDAVVAVGCEAQISGSIFWLATNNANNATAASKLLQNIITTVGMAITSTGQDLGPLEDRVCTISVQNSKGKIKNYRSKLRRAISHIREYLEQSGLKDDQVVDTLEAINTRLETHESIVDEQFRLQLRLAFKALDALLKEHGSVYETARHTIGRLYSWKKYARFVTQNALQFGSILSRARVEVVPTQHLTATQSIPVESTVRGVLIKVFGQQGAIMDYAANQLESTQERIDQLVKADQAPILHAEVAVAHHFHTNRLKPFGNYIGCSKPSCYACKLYLDHHPAGFAPRQHHGNAWPRWSFPTLQDEVGQDDESATIKLARKMSKAMRRDVETCIYGEQYGCRRIYESLTGMTKLTMSA